ncbi:ABC transporter ATP-binding protein [Ravibacter arvi]|uniref:ABC transporter ATP-binding protein n=1 Tax=Ravibacter arvi TaxID=2051041 RepID=A0ABP8LUQ0_9BACT
MSIGIGIDSIRYRYPGEDFEALRSVRFSVEPGDIFGLLGPNGAGKTTLMSIMVGILKADSGTVSYHDGGSRLDERRIRRVIGYVPQDYAFYQELTPVQNLAYFGAMYDLPRKVIRSRTEELLHVLGLSNVADKKVGFFSGGMKRRINLAIGIIHEPGVIFLDEPTVGVDVQSKQAIVDFLKRLNAHNTTIVYTSHHLAEAEELCNRIALIDNGAVIAYDHLSALLKANNSKDLQSLFLNLTGAGYRD